MSKLAKSLNDYIEQATDNIVTDRAAAQSLLTQPAAWRQTPRSCLVTQCLVLISTH
jgi:hypothetical protein